jgi:hypothetical protein
MMVLVLFMKGSFAVTPELLRSYKGEPHFDRDAQLSGFKREADICPLFPGAGFKTGSIISIFFCFLGC